MNMFAEEEQKLRNKLKTIDVDNMTPLEAIQLLSELRKLISD